MTVFWLLVNVKRSSTPQRLVLIWRPQALEKRKVAALPSVSGRVTILFDKRVLEFAFPELAAATRFDYADFLEPFCAMCRITVVASASIEPLVVFGRSGSVIGDLFGNDWFLFHKPASSARSFDSCFLGPPAES